MFCLVIEKKEKIAMEIYDIPNLNMTSVGYICKHFDVYHHISNTQVRMYASISNYLDCYHQYGSDHFHNSLVFAYTLMDFNNGFVLLLFFLILNLPNLEK